jgi:hypothetical protein
VRRKRAMVRGWMRVASRIRRTVHPADSIERSCFCLSIRRLFPMGMVLLAPGLPGQPAKRITLGAPYVSGRESLWVSADNQSKRISVYRLPGKGYNRLGESDAEPCTTSPFHLDLASPNKVNRGGLARRLRRGKKRPKNEIKMKKWMRYQSLRETWNQN